MRRETARLLEGYHPDLASVLERGRLRGPSRRLSGDWLAKAMRFDPGTTARIAGRQVALDAEAWGAVQSAQRVRVAVRLARARVGGRRAQVWPVREARERVRIEEGLKADAQIQNEPAKDLPLEIDDLAGRGAVRGLPERDHVAMPPLVGGTRYVDSEKGDDGNTGGMEVMELGENEYIYFISPWKTLRKVESWLQGIADAAGGRPVEETAVYLCRGRTWDGEEERDEYGLARGDYIDWKTLRGVRMTRDREAILEIDGFHATEASPLILSSYSSRGAVLGSFADHEPIVNGTRATTTSPTREPKYGDERIGIKFTNCHHVAVSELNIRGFGTGISIRGNSKHHTYSRLYLHDLAEYGIIFGVKQEDAGYSDRANYHLLFVSQTLHSAIQRIINHEDYPEYIEVVGCTFRSIGYDTAGTDIMIGFLATNCTISANSMAGDAVRGLDGIDSQGGSSGHLIEKNTIYNHAKFCRIDDTYKAVLQEAASPVVGAEYELLHPCEGEDGSGSTAGVTTEYN